MKKNSSEHVIIGKHFIPSDSTLHVLHVQADMEKVVISKAKRKSVSSSEAVIRKQKTSIENVQAEQAKKRLILARTAYVGLFAEYKRHLREKREVFESTMASLGGRHRHMPHGSKPSYLKEAESEYQQALRDVIRYTFAVGNEGDVRSRGTFLEAEQYAFEASLVSAYSRLEQKILEKTMKIWNKTAKVDRVGFSGLLLHIATYTTENDVQSVRSYRTAQKIQEKSSRLSIDRVTSKNK